uniref:SWIM-type zinc finger 7 associated protein 1 n=1 Tax=Latimeria chalumnae TaxID=7897 RepID=H3B5Z3_LATCH
RMAGVIRQALKCYSGEESMADSTPISGNGSCLLLGEGSSGKTSLLFLAALVAAEEGKKVMFLSPKPIQALPAPLLESRAGLNPLSLKKIQFLYPQSREEFMKLIATVHEKGSSLPSLIIVDGLEAYLTDNIKQTAHISALLVDMAAFISENIGTVSTSNEDPNGECCLLVSLTHPAQGEDETDGGQSLSVIGRYLPSNCMLERDLDPLQEEQGERVFRERGSRSEEEGWGIVFKPDGSIKILLVPGKTKTP